MPNYAKCHGGGYLLSLSVSVSVSARSGISARVNHSQGLWWYTALVGMPHNKCYADRRKSNPVIATVYEIFRQVTITTSISCTSSVNPLISGMYNTGRIFGQSVIKHRSHIRLG